MPVICLKSGVSLEKVGDGQYNLIAPEVVLPEEETVVTSYTTYFEMSDEVTNYEGFTFEVPENVNVVKINYSTTSPWVLEEILLVMRGATSDVWEHAAEVGTEPYGEIYINVTPGKSYTWYVGVDDPLGGSELMLDVSLRVVYSKSINETEADYSDL